MAAQLRIAVLTACGYETALVRRYMQPQQRDITPVGILWQGAIKHCRVVLLRCGIGPNRAMQAANWLSNRYALQCMINVGFVGAVQPDLHSGDAILAQQIQACTAPCLHIPATFADPMTPTPQLLRLADQAATPATFALYHGALLSVDNVITQATLKQHLGQLSGALAVDMEAHSMARIATQQQLPFVSLKTVFDTCDDDLPASITQCTAPDGTVHPAHLIYNLLRHPALFTDLPRWRRKAKTAGQHLGNWLHRFLTLLILQGE